MALAALATRLAHAAPPLARLFLRAWGRLTPADRPHYLLLKLRRSLNVRSYRLGRLRSGERMKCDPFDVVGRAIYLSGVFEPETLDLFEKLVPEGGVVFDVGAHVGQYSVRAGTLVGSTGAVHAFEPDPATCRVLRSNVKRNHSKNVVVHQCGLTDHEGSERFFPGNAGNIGGGSLRFNHNSLGAAITVDIMTLDTFATQLQRLDVVKIDVEGAELSVLRGAEHALHVYRPIVIMELSIHVAKFNYSYNDLASWLTQHEYHLFRIGIGPLVPWKKSASDPTSYNILAVHSSAIQTLIASKILDVSGTVSA